jgi:hypothetical protein
VLGFAGCFKSSCLGDFEVWPSFGLPSLNRLIPLILAVAGAVISWRSTGAVFSFSFGALYVSDSAFGPGASPNFVWTFSGIAAGARCEFSEDRRLHVHGQASYLTWKSERDGSTWARKLCGKLFLVVFWRRKGKVFSELR